MATEVFAHIHRGVFYAAAAAARRGAQSHGTLWLQGNDLEKHLSFLFFFSHVVNQHHSTDLDSSRRFEEKTACFCTVTPART